MNDFSMSAAEFNRNYYVPVMIKSDISLRSISLARQKKIMIFSFLPQPFTSTPVQNVSSKGAGTGVKFIAIQQD